MQNLLTINGKKYIKLGDNTVYGSEAEAQRRAEKMLDLEWVKKYNIKDKLASLFDEGVPVKVGGYDAVKKTGTVLVQVHVEKVGSSNQKSCSGSVNSIDETEYIDGKKTWLYTEAAESGSTRKEFFEIIGVDGVFFHDQIKINDR